jgi:hypothetical protein
MNSARAEAYLEVCATLSSEDGVTLRHNEAAVLRHAIDALFFEEESSQDSLEEARGLLQELEDSERWSEERASRLLDAVERCGALVSA